jgi:hypothetical protein
VEHTVISQFLLRALLAPIILLWGYHLAQRRYREEAQRKRTATLLLTLLLIGVWVAAFFLRRLRIDDVFLSPVFIVAAIILIAERRTLLPYRARCVRCGAPLSVRTVFFMDSNACGSCEPLVRARGPLDRDSQEGDSV